MNADDPTGPESARYAQEPLDPAHPGQGGGPKGGLTRAHDVRLPGLRGPAIRPAVVRVVPEALHPGRVRLLECDECGCVHLLGDVLAGFGIRLEEDALPIKLRPKTRRQTQD